jgi:hypothetical protein
MPARGQADEIPRLDSDSTSDLDMMRLINSEAD